MSKTIYPSQPPFKPTKSLLQFMLSCGMLIAEVVFKQGQRAKHRFGGNYKPNGGYATARKPKTGPEGLPPKNV